MDKTAEVHMCSSDNNLLGKGFFTIADIIEPENY